MRYREIGKEIMENAIAFIGLGKMGLPMALHLANAGHAVVGFDPSAERRTLADHAALPVTSAVDELIKSSSIMISSLPNDEALEQVSAQLCRSANAGSIYIDASTVSLEASARVAQVLAHAGITYLRSTVSGNNVMAEAATLTIMVSGDQAAFEACKKLFQCWGEKSFYLGDGEQARLMKLAINLMITLTSGMLAEALSLGRKGGLEWSDMWQVIDASAVGSPIVKAKASALSKRDFTATFTVEQMRKDVGLILDAGKMLNVPLGLTALTAQLLSSASAQGYAGEDYAAIIKVVEQAANLSEAAL
ncbi:NAD(P)-dependent oxidoreductase [Paraburkholderia sp. RL17-373-BIF-A]|uniref:NAD(P)-dependent oxidoreductase n=1 Tax=Paraburkholderia sp. RL17-373-BIF-A TaxID=3031629 RepID=UPI0038BC289D